jgi:serine/threonine protein kinase
MRDPVVGDRLDQYELTELLARSGMASIFKAIDHDSGATVALKIPHLQFESDVVFFERFRREELIGQRLDHPSVVKALKPREKSRMYIAMEFVEGRSLRAMLDQQRPLPALLALNIATQICETLVYLHSEGLVHRDLKPENVLITATGRAKILDFGIALDESARRMTWVGLSNTIGTPNYIAPEQIGGRRGDVRSDIYALGTMLYEMLTGELPFSATNVHSFMRAKTSDEPRPPSYHVPGFDPALEAVILKAIARHPRDRYPTAVDFLAHLRDPAAAPAVDAETGRGARRLVRRRTRAGVMVVLVLAGLGTLVWLSSAHGPPDHLEDHGATPAPMQGEPK